MKIVAVISLYAAAWVLCDRFEILAGFAPFISLGVFAVAAPILDS